VLALAALTSPSASATVPVTLGVPTSLTVSLGGSSYVVGVVNEAPVAGRRVDLELKTPTGWFSVAHTTTDALGGYRIAVPTWWYGAHTWRAQAAATDTSPALTSATTATVTVKTPAAAGRATAYSRMPGKARWDACNPVPYYLNPTKAPVGALADIHTKLVPWSKTAHSGMPASGVAYAFTTPRRVGRLAGSTVGLGGSMYTISSKGRWFTAGGVAIDRTFHWSHGLLRNVVMHETGHAVGLDHVTDRHEVMYPSANGSQSWGAGDLTGLHAVGLSQGC
jgi:hypothetical protein